MVFNMLQAFLSANLQWLLFKFVQLIKTDKIFLPIFVTINY